MMPEKIYARPDTHEGVWSSEAGGYQNEVCYGRADLVPAVERPYIMGDDGVPRQVPAVALGMLKAAFMAGWNCSGEGFNSEYDSCGPDEVEKHLEEKFRNHLEAAGVKNG